MNFQPDESQDALSGLARQVLADHAGHDRARLVEDEDGFDRQAWEALGATGLVAAIGSGEGGVVGAAGVAAEIGRHVATVPAFALLTPLIVAGELGLELHPQLPAGSFLTTLGLEEVGSAEVRRSRTQATGDGTLTGSKPLVPALHEADTVLVSAQGIDGAGLFLVKTDQTGVEQHRVRTTDRGSAAELVLAGAKARRVGGEAVLSRTEQIATVLICATLVGLCRAATEGAASHVKERQQFGRPIASFQAPVLRLADAHIDLEAMQVTMLQAAWQLDENRDARAAVSVAKWWAAEGGHRTLHTAQHLHGGLGADIEYPAHRYFLRGKQLVDTLGGSAFHARRLGAVLAAQAKEALV